MYPKRNMMRNLHDISLPWRITAVAHFRRSQSNETEPKINRTQLVGLLFDWFGNQTSSNRNFSASSINRTREFHYRTQWNLIDAISSISFGRKTKRIQFEMNRKDLPLVCMRSTLK